MREVPLIVAIDGIDKSGKTTVLPKIKKRLQDTLNVTDDDICIVKFDIAKLTGEIGEQVRDREKQINTSDKAIDTKVFWKMWNFLKGEIDNYRKVTTGKKIILLDRSIFSFVVNRGRALGYSDEKIAHLWALLEKKGLPNPDAFIHAVADKETIEQRFKKINQKGEVMSDTDVITRKDIVGSIQSYKAIEKMFISPDKIIHFDTSGMFLGDEPEEKNESYEKQLTDIISFISTKYAHGVFEEVY